MGRRIRIFTSDGIYFVTNRCHQRRFFFRPGKAVNDIILGILARCAQQYGVEIFAFVFMSNHFHMLIRCPWLLIHRFMEQFQSQLARALNKHWGRSNSFYEGRYKDSVVLDDASAVDKLVYTMCNPCESDLVRHPKLWPGLSSWSYFVSGQPMVGRWVNKAERRRLLRKYDDMSFEQATDEATEEYALEMTPLPEFAGLDEQQWRDKMCRRVKERAEQLAEERTRPCVGAKKILAQRFDDRPEPEQKSPQPVCHGADADERRAYIEQVRRTTERYRRAVHKWRGGQSPADFPTGTIPPGHIRCVGAPVPDPPPPFGPPG